MVKSITSTLILLTSVSALSNPLCLNIYKLDNGRPETAKIAFKSISQILKPTTDQINLSIENFNRTRSQMRDHAKMDEYQKILNSKMSPEIAELEVKKLIKSGFVLGPLHELFFSKALNINDFGFDQDSFLASHHINNYRNSLQVFQTKLNDNSESGRQYRREVAERMYGITEDYLSKLPKDSETFSLNGENQKQKFLDKALSALQGYSESSKYIFVHRYKISLSRVFKMTESLLETKQLDGHKEFLISLYENSLKEISGNALSRTSASVSIMAQKAASLAPAAIGVALSFHSGSDLAVPLSIVAGVAFGATSNLIYTKSTEFSKSTWIKAKNFFNRKKVSDHLIEALEDPHNNVTIKELAKIENIEDQLDLKFSYIKYDIAKDLTSELNLPTWGTELATGINNVSLRIDILLEQYQDLIGKLDPTVKAILNEPKSVSSTEIKKLNFNKDMIILKLVNLLVDLEAIKTDTLSVSVALDQYIERAQQFTTKSAVSDYFMVSKQRQFLQQIEILKALSNGMKKIDNQLLLNIDSMNKIYNVQDMNTVVDIDSKLEIR